MNRRRQQLLAAVAALGLLAAPACAWSQVRTVKIDLANLREDGPTYYAFVDDEAAAAESSEVELPAMWLGIHLGEVPEILRNHLGLERGVLSEHVAPESPADKAGVEAQDILLELVGKSVSKPEDVVEVMRQVKENDDVEIVVLRKGKEITLKAKPAPRPVAEKRETETAPPVTTSGRAASQQEFLRHQHQALKALERALADREAMGFVLPRPGILAEARPALPEDVTIRLVHKGSEPVRIAVSQGAKNWEVTEKNLDDLPEELRPHVLALLRGPVPFTVKLPDVAKGDVVISRPLTTFGAKVATPAVATEVQSTNDKLDQVLKEVRSLRKQVEKLEAQSRQ
jgi:serine protease Do